ncbi:MAG: permease, partial [Candidatus Pacearchaeota archaeon]
MEREEWHMLFWIVLVFGILYFVPSNADWFRTSILSAFDLLHDYARKHVLTCLVPALFIAGAISVFVKKEAVLKYLGHKSKKIVSYSIASVSGAILAVCSCTILPLFAGIRKRGAGLGPAITFLFAGPAINIAAIFLTASVLGFKIGFARAIAAILLSIIIGLTMAFIFREKAEQGGLFMQESKDVQISKKILFVFFGLMLCVLVVNGLQINTLIKYLLM